MRIVALTLAILGAAAPAVAANLVTNGSFETGYVKNTQFGADFASGVGPTGWTSASTSGYNLYFDGKTATTIDAASQYGGSQKFYSSFTGASPDGGKFVALDGDTSYHGALTQSISGLTAGKSYDLKFYWGGGQFDNRTGPTTERLDVSLGDMTQSTATLPNVSQGFTGWKTAFMTFKATAGTETLSQGTPSGLPPIAVLDGVSLNAVPEPATWAMMLVGFGFVGFATRRRASMRSFAA